MKKQEIKRKIVRKIIIEMRVHDIAEKYVDSFPHCTLIVRKLVNDGSALQYTLEHSN